MKMIAEYLEHVLHFLTDRGGSNRRGVQDHPDPQSRGLQEIGGEASGGTESLASADARKFKL
jgi:hypothetical protein